MAAIIGSVVGLVVTVAAVAWCCSRRRTCGSKHRSPPSDHHVQSNDLPSVTLSDVNFQGAGLQVPSLRRRGEEEQEMTDGIYFTGSREENKSHIEEGIQEVKKTAFLANVSSNGQLRVMETKEEVHLSIVFSKRKPHFGVAVYP